MEDLREKTTEELYEIKKRKPVPGIMTHEIDTELARRLQQANLEQISVLVKFPIPKFKN